MALPGRTPYRAVEAFLEPLKQTISCLASTQITVSPGGREDVDKVHALVVNRNQALQLRSDQQKYLLRIRMGYEIVETESEPAERWRVSTRVYDYEIQLDSGEAIVSYHWHPGSKVTEPHMHLGSTQLSEDAVLSHKSHLATSRVPLEAVVRQCITELKVKPYRKDWAPVLEECEQRFVRHRTWP